MALLTACGFLSGCGALTAAGFALNWSCEYGGRARKLRGVVQPKNLADLRAEFHMAPFEAAIRGKTRCAQPLIGQCSQREAVILHTVKDRFIEKRTSPPGTPAEEEKWEREERRSSNEMVEAPHWSIAFGQVEVPIQDGWAAAEHSGVIVRTAHRMNPTPEAERNRVTEKRVGERCVGERVQERMLPVDTPLTVLGTIEQETDHKWSRVFPGAVRMDGAYLLMHPKEFSRKTVSELTIEAQGKADMWRNVAGAAAILGAGLLATSVRSYIQKRSQE